MKFIAIVGTNASFSYNRKLLWYMKKHFAGQAEIEIQEIAGIPLFCEDHDGQPDSVKALAKAIADSDGVIFATPEYDHAIPASLKSVIEWLSWGKDHPLNNVPTMVVGASLGNLGTVFAQDNLRKILASPGVDAFVLPANQFLLGRAKEVFDEAGDLLDEKSIACLEHCFGNFLVFAESLKPMRALAFDRTQAGKDGEKPTIDTETGASEGDEVVDLNSSNENAVLAMLDAQTASRLLDDENLEGDEK